MNWSDPETYAGLVFLLLSPVIPIALAALGELVVEKAGVLNLGVEGMMIIGAIAGFAVSVETGSPFVGLIAAMVAGAMLSLIFGVLTQVLLANQVATGLALTLFGLGLAALLGHSYNGIKPPPSPRLSVEGLSDLPFFGRALFSHDMVVYLTVFLTAAVWVFLRHTRGGMILRAVGENHESAHALGYRVVRIRLCAILFGGAMAGLGGAYVSLIRVPQWTEGMTAGVGWIALAIVVFAAWRPWWVLLGALLFGGVQVMQFILQGEQVGIGEPYLAMTPYLATILVLVFVSSGRASAALQAPASLGRSFHASG